MNLVKRGEIWLVKFHPSIGNELTKYRPAVVINDLKKIDSRFVCIAPFTTNIKKFHSSEVVISNSALQTKSLLLTWYLSTIDKDRLQVKLGNLTKEEQATVNIALKSIFNE